MGQREDKDRPHKVGPYQEQVWKNREQEGERSWKEEICEHQGLDSGCAEGQKGTRRRGLRRNQEGVGTLQKGKGIVQPVSVRFDVTKDKLLRSWSFMVQQAPFFPHCVDVTSEMYISDAVK